MVRSRRRESNIQLNARFRRCSLPVDDVFIGIIYHGEGRIITKQRIDRGVFRWRVHVRHRVQIEID